MFTPVPWNTRTCTLLLEDDSQASQLLAAAFGSEENGWGEDGESERKRILKGFSTICSLAEAYQFREPVSFDVVQDYCQVIAFPTDLSTITKRLENGFYRYVSLGWFFGGSGLIRFLF